MAVYLMIKVTFNFMTFIVESFEIISLFYSTIVYMTTELIT